MILCEKQHASINSQKKTLWKYTVLVPINNLGHVANLLFIVNSTVLKDEQCDYIKWSEMMVNLLLMCK